MPMSQSASSSPTLRSTSRVMMTGLIGPDLRREDCWSGPSHDDWRNTCLMECCRCNPAKKPGISDGPSSKDGYHIYRALPSRYRTWRRHSDQCQSETRPVYMLAAVQCLGLRHVLVAALTSGYRDIIASNRGLDQIGAAAVHVGTDDEARGRLAPETAHPPFFREDDGMKSCDRSAPASLRI